MRENIKPPLPEEIQVAIDAVPPFQQEMVAQCYVGLKVEWLLPFQDVSSDPFTATKADICTISMIRAGTGVIYVVCEEVDLSKYPQFKTLRRDSQMWVTGKIRKATRDMFWLSDCEFRFV